MSARRPRPVPPPIGRYSNARAIPVGDATLLFLSGIAALGEHPFDVERQAESIFRSMARLLKAHGGELSHLVKITAFLADIRGEYERYNRVRNRVFRDVPVPPASSSVGITMNLSAELRIEIEGIAVIPARAAPPAVARPVRAATARKPRGKRR